MNKPAGVTSRGVVNAVCRVTRLDRVGHAGTLDPFATGVLLVCVGSATRLVPILQEFDKEYVAEFCLGRRSDTDDITGEVTELVDPPLVSRDALVARLLFYQGMFDQVPPAYSAVQLEGRRAHAIARSGQIVALPARQVLVREMELLGFEYPRFRLRIVCGSGTYVRAIGRDLGRDLGSAAITVALERTRIGPFSVENAIAVDALSSEVVTQALHPASAAVSHYPHCTIGEPEWHAFRHGRSCTLPNVETIPPGTPVACLTPTGRLAVIAIRPQMDATLFKPEMVFPTAFDP